MKYIVYAVLLGLVFSYPAVAQDDLDSEFTKTILAHKNMGRYRVIAGKMLRSAEEIKELRITPEQSFLIGEALSRGEKEINELEEMMTRAKSAEESKELSSQYTPTLRKTHIEIVAVLTHSQRERWAQVAFQKHLSSSRSLDMYQHRSIQPFIQLTDSQQTELYKAVSDANAEYLEALLALNEKYRQKILDGVNPSIRDKIDPVVGKPWFRFQSRGKSVLSNDVGNKK